MEETIRELKKLSFVKGVYLFGSKAKGTAKPYSDTDLCVFTEKITVKQKMQILRLNDKDIDVVIFNELPISIQASIFRDGKAIYIKQKKIIQDAKYWTLKRYLDFSHIIKNHIKQALAP